MPKDLSHIVTITLRPAGFFLEIAADDQGLVLPDLQEYVACLNIPGLNGEAMKKAFGLQRGKPYQIAPLPPRSVFDTAAVPQPKRRPARWIKPLFNKNTPFTKANNILVVDTSQSMVQSVNAAFADAQKLTARFANKPQDFFDSITKKPPDLILLSANLGKVDGSLLSYRIRTTPTTAGIPVLMYSPARPRHEIVRLFDAGITDYMMVPANPRTLRDKITSALSQVRKTIPLAKEKAAAAAPKKSAGGEQTQPEAAKATTAITLDGLLAKVKELLAMPNILERVMKIADDASAGAAELAQAVRSDPATAATVLKKANTAFFGKKEPISDVQEAIVRIGLQEVKTMVLGMSVVKQFSTKQKSSGFNRLDFWKHSLATAVLGRIFARQEKFPDPDNAFLGGLLHDLGKIILDEYANPPFDDIIMKAISGRTSLYKVEREVLGFTHVDVGKRLVAEWKFPENLSTAVARHHTPEEKDKEKKKPQDLLLTRFIYIANLVAKAMGVGSGGDLSLHELPLTQWVKSFTKIKLDKEALAQVNKELVEIGEFLNISGEIGEAVKESKEPRSEIILLDSLYETRLLNIAEIHLTAVGHNVVAVSRESDIPAIDAAKKHAFCVHLASYDKMKEVFDKLKPHLLETTPVAFILPEEEKNLKEKLKEETRPAFLAQNQVILFEPYDAEQLQNALEAG